MSSAQPAFNVPTSVVIAVLALVVVHVIRAALPEEESLSMLLALAFIPARYADHISGLPGGEWAGVTSFISYMFVHGDLAHLVINTIWMLAFGSAVAKRIGDWRFVTFSLVCGVAGALVHLVLHFGESVPVVGASAAISGQMAGAIRFMLGAGRSIIRSPADLTDVPLAGVRQTLTDTRLLGFMAVWMLLNVLFGVGGFQLDGSGGGIAWEAHIGGFVCGLLLFGAFDRAAHRMRDIAFRP